MLFSPFVADEQQCRGTKGFAQHCECVAGRQMLRNRWSYRVKAVIEETPLDAIKQGIGFEQISEKTLGRPRSLRRPIACEAWP
jgi:hypothetical protein